MDKVIIKGVASRLRICIIVLKMKFLNCIHNPRDRLTGTRGPIHLAMLIEHGLGHPVNALVTGSSS